MGRIKPRVKCTEEGCDVLVDITCKGPCRMCRELAREAAKQKRVDVKDVEHHAPGSVVMVMRPIRSRLQGAYHLGVVKSAREMYRVRLWLNGAWKDVSTNFESVRPWTPRDPWPLPTGAPPHNPPPGAPTSPPRT